MNDIEYWQSTLPSPTLLTKIAEGTTVIRHENVNGVQHAASGRGPFGKLTVLGLMQMVEVGSRLRNELHLDDDADDEQHHLDDDGHIHIQRGRLFSNKNPIHPNKIKVKSTDFPRTLQSVQSLLIGLFPDGLPEGTSIDIDARHTNVMIPDPQPRNSKEQIEMEIMLTKRKHIQERELELKGLARKVTQELKSFISDDVNSAAFGIGEDCGDKDDQKLSLTWSQLSEIMTCLKVRDMLPDTISIEEFETATSHSAWKWFENLRNATLAKLAMNQFMTFILDTLHYGHNRSKGIQVNNNDNGEDDETMLHIYSCHDSSLIGLLCAFRLQQPAEWPEYGSFLKIELFESELVTPEEEDNHTNAIGEKEYYVRFSLNGSILKCQWGLGENDYLEPMNMIPFHHLVDSITREHNE